MAFTWEAVVQIILLMLALRALHMVSASDSCSEVRRSFAAKRIGPVKMVPYDAHEAKDLRVCPNTGLTCCNRQMETRFQTTAKKEVQETLKYKTSSLKFNFRSFGEKFQDDVVETFTIARNSTREVVRRLLRKKLNTPALRSALSVLDRLYRSLTLQTSGDDVTKAFNRFADKLFLLLVDVKYNITESDIPYEKCVADQRAELHPFMDVPTISAANLTTALELARALHEGLKAGAQAVNVTESLRLSKSCQTALLKMQFCSHCLGLTLFKPCVGLCRNVLRGCFASVTELDQYWNYYVTSLVDVTERMRSTESKFNLEIALEDFQNKLSSSLSIILENITTLRETVEKGCKNTKTLNRSKRNSEHPSPPKSMHSGNKLGAKASEKHGGRRRHRGGRKNGRNDKYDVRQGFDMALKELEEEDPFASSTVQTPRVRPPHEVLRNPMKRIWPRKAGEKNIVESKKPTSQLHNRIRRFINSLNLSMNFYRHLPDDMCAPGAGMTIEVANREKCWNGGAIVERYEKEVVPSGFGKQGENPEVKVLKVEKEVIEAIESLRETAMMLLYAADKKEIPGILLHTPIYEKRDDVPEVPKTKTPKFPCDDEDDCQEGSGKDKDFYPESQDHGKGSPDTPVEKDIEIIIIENKSRNNTTKLTGPPTDDVIIDVTVEKEEEVKCKGKKKCRKGKGSRKKPNNGHSKKSDVTSRDVTTKDPGNSAPSFSHSNLMGWILYAVVTRLVLTYFQN